MGNILWSAQKSPYFRGHFLYIVAVPRRHGADFAHNVPRGTLFLQNCGSAKCSTWNISGCALPCPGEVFVWMRVFSSGGAGGLGEAFESKLPFPFSGQSLLAAARGVSDTLHSHRAACSLRGALRGGSAASGSAGIGRRAGQNGQERRPDLPGISLSRRRRGKKSASPCLRTTGRRLRGIALV